MFSSAVTSPFLFFSILRPPPRPTLFPYTTLFRSRAQPRAPRTLLRRAALRRARCGRAPHTRARRLEDPRPPGDRKSTRLNSSHEWISYAVFCLKKKKKKRKTNDNKKTEIKLVSRI